MSSAPTSPSSPVEELRLLRQFEGPAKDFWPRLAAALGALAGAHRCLLALKPPGEGATWKKLHDWQPEAAVPADAEFQSLLISLADQGTASPSQRVLERSRAIAGAHRILTPGNAETLVALFLWTGSDEDQVREALERIALSSDAAESYRQFQHSRKSVHDGSNAASAVELVAQLNEANRFFPLALGLCNALATRLNADRVSLGWIERGELRLRAVSRQEVLNRQMAAAQSLESVMEEAADQDAEILFPPAEGESWITRDHARHSHEHQMAHLASVPLRLGKRVVGCITAERNSSAFRPDEVDHLRVSSSLTTRRLQDIWERDRWWGSRLALWIKDRLGRLIGYQNTWAKLIGLLTAAVLLGLFLIRWPYRVEGSFTLRTDEMAFLTAPFDGYLAEVQVRPGDVVTNSQSLLRLDTRELLLEESAAIADLTRYQREAEKARSSRALGDMRIAEALAQQSQARLDLVRQRLNFSTVRTPFPGVIIEGDLRDRLGAPVRQGDALLRVAQLRDLYVDIDVPERDIHELSGSETGEIAFLSQPRLKFPVKGIALEPVAITRESGNVFKLRCRLVDPPAGWFRPGMTGIAKLDVGPRRLIWIFTHRTVDFLRMFFWW